MRRLLHCASPERAHSVSYRSLYNVRNKAELLERLEEFYRLSKVRGGGCAGEAHAVASAPVPPQRVLATTSSSASAAH